eukprot:5739807-Amphidinium_carterae.1
MHACCTKKPNGLVGRAQPLRSFQTLAGQSKSHHLVCVALLAPSEMKVRCGLREGLRKGRPLHWPALPSALPCLQNCGAKKTFVQE